MANEGIDGFKKYIKRGRSTVPKVTVRKNRVIAFNSAAVNKYDLDVYQYAVFYISNDKKRVAVQFTNDDKESGIINIQRRVGNFQISAGHFIGMFDIDASSNRNYDFQWDESRKIAYFRPKRVIEKPLYKRSKNGQENRIEKGDEEIRSYTSNKDARHSS
jgi:hypothetical protein